MNAFVNTGKIIRVTARVVTGYVSSDDKGSRLDDLYGVITDTSRLIVSQQHFIKIMLLLQR